VGRHVNERLDRHVRVNERAAADTAGCEHVRLVERVIAIKRLRAFAARKEIGNSVREILQTTERTARFDN